MTNSATHFKIGLLAIASLVALVIAGLGLGVHALKRKTVAYHTYFDESVQGLEIGSPVKFRGVTIGSVSQIAVAPDHVHIEVTLAILETNARSLAVTPAMRTQLSTMGITGVKLIDIDFVDPSKNPPPQLPFPPQPNYIPSQPSLLGNLAAAGQRASELIDQGVTTLKKLDAIAEEVRSRRVVEHVASTAQSLDHLVGRADRVGIADKLARVLDHFDGDRGLVAGTQRAIDSIADFGRNARGATDELGQTIRDLGDAARAVRDLSRAIERDPDMLVKGRPKSRRR